MWSQLNTYFSLFSWETLKHKKHPELVSLCSLRWPFVLCDSHQLVSEPLAKVEVDTTFLSKIVPVLTKKFFRKEGSSVLPTNNQNSWVEIGALALRRPGWGTKSVDYQRVTWNQQNRIYEEIYAKGLHLDEKWEAWHDSNLFEKELVILVDCKLKISEMNAMYTRKTNWNLSYIN